MRKRLLDKGILFVVVLLMMVGCEQRAPQSSAVLKVGEPFPELNLVSLEGEEFPLSGFRGKLLVVNVWATWCGPCRRELPSLESLEKLLDKDKFAVLGLSIDEDTLLVREYLADKGISLPVFFNGDGELDYASLGINVFPYTFIITPDGRLAERYPGEEVWNSAEVVHNLQTLIE